MVFTMKKTNAVIYVIFASFPERARGDFRSESLILFFLRYAVIVFTDDVRGGIDY